MDNRPSGKTGIRRGIASEALAADRLRTLKLLKNIWRWRD